eukprot:113355-Rhodomonas_salina.4
MELCFGGKEENGRYSLPGIPTTRVIALPLVGVPFSKTLFRPASILEYRRSRGEQYYFCTGQPACMHTLTSTDSDTGTWYPGTTVGLQSRSNLKPGQLSSTSAGPGAGARWHPRPPAGTRPVRWVPTKDRHVTTRNGTVTRLVIYHHHDARRGRRRRARDAKLSVSSARARAAT